MKDIINNLKKFDRSKIQILVAINFISSKNNDEECVMHSKSDKVKIMISDKSDEVLKELFESFLNRYQIGLETSIRSSDFIFNCVHLLYYKYHKINFKQGE